MKNKVFILSMMLLVALGFSSCEKDKNSGCEIVRFSINNVEGKISGTEITLTLPAQTDLTKLTADVTVSDDATVTPASGETVDFSGTVVYTVIAEDGSKKKYTVNVSKNRGTTIESFIFKGIQPEVRARVDNYDGTITAVMPFGTDLTQLVPVITLSSDKGTVSPASDKSQDFTNPVTYTVEDTDGNILTYTATITVESASDKNIRSFVFEGLSPEVYGVIDESAKTITVTIPYAESFKQIPTITIPSVASVSPASGIIQDFSDPVTYTVIARDQSKATYTVTVVRKALEPRITSISKNPLEQGDLFEIWGIFGEQNTASLSNGSQTYELLNVSAHNGFLLATVPSGIPEGSYTLSVTSNGIATSFDEKVVIKANGSNPVLTSFMKDQYTAFTYEQIIVNGQNLEGNANCFVMPVTGGDYVSPQGIMINTDGTQGTIYPEYLDQLPAGTYSFWLVVNNVKSNVLTLKVVENTQPAPEITSVNGLENGDICEGGTLVINGKNLENAKVRVITSRGTTCVPTVGGVTANQISMSTSGLNIQYGEDLKIVVTANGKSAEYKWFRIMNCTKDIRISSINGSTQHVQIKKGETATIVGENFPVTLAPRVILSYSNGDIYSEPKVTYSNRVEVKFAADKVEAGSPDLVLTVIWGNDTAIFDGWVQITE